MQLSVPPPCDLESRALHDANRASFLVMCLGGVSLTGFFTMGMSLIRLGSLALLGMAGMLSGVCALGVACLVALHAIRRDAEAERLREAREGKHESSMGGLDFE